MSFALAEILPGVIERDEKKIWPADIIKQMAELGFMGMLVDEKWNGSSLDTISYTIVMEEIARVDASSAVVMSFILLREMALAISILFSG